MAPLVMSQANGNTPAIGGLFAGVSFFLLQKVPSRSAFIDKIQSNGGRVVKLEAQADHVIADHLRKDCPPGSISYEFIDASIRDGAVADPADHPAGPEKGAVRAVGSTGVPAKGTRTAFTAEDDKVLWRWVQKAQSEGGMVKGNEIYKQLERVNNRHSFQAWRDRYIKKLMDRPPEGVDVDQPEPEDGDPGASTHANGGVNGVDGVNDEVLFDKDDFDALMANADDIRCIDDSQKEDAWIAWASANPKHEAREWQDFWEETVLPFYLQQRHDEKATKKRKRNTREETEEKPMSQKEGKKAVKAPVEEKNEPPQEDTPTKAKRKRETPIPRNTAAAKKKYGRKKQRPDFSEIFDEEAEDTPLVPPRPKPAPVAVNTNTDPIEILSDHDEPVQAVEPGANADVKDEVDDGGFHLEGDDIVMGPVGQVNLPTSDANRAAERQLRHESRQANGATGSTPQQQTSNIPTSDANRAAAHQLRREQDVDSSTPQQVASNVPTSEANRAAAEQLRQEQVVNGSTPHRPLSKLPTSDAKGAVERQVRQSLVTGPKGAPAAIWETRESEAFAEKLRAGLTVKKALEAAGINRSESAGRNHKKWLLENRPGVLGADVSEVPGDALDEDDDAAKVDDEAEEGDITISNHLLEDGAVEDGLPGDEVVEPDVGGNLLTEANLASQEAEHRGKILRGADIEEDDLEKDQQDFINYLQALQDAGKIHPPKPGPHRLKPETQNEVHVEEEPGPTSSELPDVTQYTQNEGELSPEQQQRPQEQQTAAAAFSSSPREELLSDDTPRHDEARTKPFASFSQSAPAAVAFPALPTSSALEIEDAAEAAFEWPSSPQKERRKPAPAVQTQDESLHFETQIQYPTIADEDDQPDDEMFTTQPPAPVIEGVRYPSLPEHPAQAQQREDENVEEDHDFVQGSDGLDLSIPEPDGGFEFSSSPVRREASQATQRLKKRSAVPAAPARNTQQQAEGIIEMLSDDEESQAQQAQQPETVEISSAESESSSEMSSEPPSPGPAARRRALETQDILNAETQLPDLEMPLPPDSDEEEVAEEDEVQEQSFDVLDAKPIPPQQTRQAPPLQSPTRHVASSSRPALPTTRPATSSRRAPPPAKQSQSQPIPDEDLEEYITTMLLRHKVPESSVIDALKATSLNAELAEFVVLEAKAGRGLPRDVRGVWSEEEDRVIEGGDAGAIGEVEKKHGWEGVQARLLFLEEWRGT